MKIFALGFVLLAFAAITVNCHQWKTGECPPVEPMSAFDMKKFLGIWYVIQKTSTSSPCIIYNITRGEEPGEYQLEQLSQQALLAATPIKHEYSYTGELHSIDNDVPARMNVKFPLSVAGSSKFTIFMTDYDNYAGVFTCQKIPFGHRESATILSRTKDLDKIYTDKIRNRLASFNVDPFAMSIVNQTGCPKTEGGWNIHIDSETFSTKSIANVFRKAGEKIGDGFEYTVDLTKKIYNKFSSSDENTSNPGETSARSAKLSIEPNDDKVEWLP